jgi:hypothetical protein
MTLHSNRNHQRQRITEEAFFNKKQIVKEKIQKLSQHKRIGIHVMG